MQCGEFLRVLKGWPSKPIVVVTHPRSGTHLAIDTLRKQFQSCRSWKYPGERNDRLYINIDMMINSHPKWLDRVAVRVLKRSDRIVMKTHNFPFGAFGNSGDHREVLPYEWMSALMEHAIIIYVYRDGRDVMTSYQLFRQGFDEQAHCPIGCFLRQTDHDLSRVNYWAHHVRSWGSVPGLIRVSAEDIIRNTESTLHDLGMALGMEPLWVEPLLPRPFSGLWASRRARFFAIRPDSTAIVGGGKKVRWQSSFTPEDRRFFCDEAGNLLIELGYECSQAWAVACGDDAVSGS